MIQDGEDNDDHDQDGYDDDGKDNDDCKHYDDDGINGQLVMIMLVGFCHQQIPTSQYQY